MDLLKVYMVALERMCKDMVRTVQGKNQLIHKDLARVKGNRAQLAEETVHVKAHKATV